MNTNQLDDNIQALHIRLGILEDRLECAEHGLMEWKRIDARRIAVGKLLTDATLQKHTQLMMDI